MHPIVGDEQRLTRTVDHRTTEREENTCASTAGRPFGGRTANIGEYSFVCDTVLLLTTLSRHEKENCIVRRLLDASTAASSLPTGQTAASGSMSLSLGAENDTRLEFPQQSYLSMPDHKVHHSTMTMQQPQPRSRLQPHFSLMDNGLMVSEP